MTVKLKKGLSKEPDYYLSWHSMPYNSKKHLIQKGNVTFIFPSWSTSHVPDLGRHSCLGHTEQRTCVVKPLSSLLALVDHFLVYFSLQRLRLLKPYRCSGSYWPLLKCGCDRAIQQQDPSRQFWSWCWHRDARVSTCLQFWIIYCGFYCGFWHPTPACEKWGAPDYSTQWSLMQRHYEKLDNNALTILTLYLFV